MSQRILIRSSIFLAVIVLLPSAGRAEEATSPETVAAASEVAIDPGAVNALHAMGQYLRTLGAFEVRADTTIDEVLESGQKVQFAGTNVLKVRLPDRLMADVHSDQKWRQFYYDGKTLTLYGPRINYYSTVDAPPTVGELIRRIEERYGVAMPLVDLFYWGTDDERTSAIKAAIFVGPSVIDGNKCRHFAFRQEGVDWQIWIDMGEKPLPRKLVITTIEEPEQPQYSAVLHWNPSPSLDDSSFTFVVPEGAERIVMREIPVEPPAAE